MIAEGKVDALFFFVDPLSPHPHDVDVKALMRVSLVYNIPMALNRATADRLIASFVSLRSPRLCARVVDFAADRVLRPGMAGILPPHIRPDGSP